MTRIRPIAFGSAVLALVLGGAVSFAAPPPEHVALTNARIIPVVGEPLERGTVLIQRGKIVAVGTQVDVPYDARVFDLQGKVLFPGMLHPDTARGLDNSNESRPVTPQLDAGDALDPSQLVFEEFLRLGVTTVHVIPAGNTVIGGLGRVVRPIGMTPDEMTITPPAWLKLSVTPRSGYDRMLQMASLREAFLAADDAVEQIAEKRYEDQRKEDGKSVDVGPAEARKRGRDLVRAEDLTDETRNLIRLRGGAIRVAGEEGKRIVEPLGAIVYADQAMDVAAALRVAKDYGFTDRLVLSLGGEAFKAINALKQAAVPVILPAYLTYREEDPLTGEIKETFIPKVVHDAGLLYALQPGSDESYAERMPNYQAAVLVRNGIPRDAALRAITINPAKILGLEQRLGSLEVGKDANIVVFSGDPLDFNSVVEKVFIDGILAYEREKDVRLQRLLSGDEARENGQR